MCDCAVIVMDCYSPEGNLGLGKFFKLRKDDGINAVYEANNKLLVFIPGSRSVLRYTIFFIMFIS